MDQYVLYLINHYGYFGMFLGMVLEAVIIIIPSEAILASAGILAGRGIFSFWGAFLVGLIGSVFCAVIIYFMGYFGGRSFVKKYGKYLKGLIKNEFSYDSHDNLISETNLVGSSFEDIYYDYDDYILT